MTYTARFDVIGKDDLALAGGKGANLGELSRAGLPVPPGFVVITTAYDDFVESGGLRNEILGLASRIEDPAALESAAEEILALFARTEIPEGVAAEVRAAYRELAGDGASPVAVRSSATAEDLPGASFAGQQETYLNIRGEAALLEAVRACWASLWTARAMAYREKQNVDPASVSLAVVVQRMVEAEAAGILFTADPVSGRRDRTVISAAWGLGEAVVGGLVTPDTLVVAKASEKVVSRETADKAVMTIYTENGTTEKPVPEARRLEPVISDRSATKLARYGAMIEELYGAPQDVEWALADGEYFILQARPVTALPEAKQPPVEWTVPDPKALYARGSIVELLPDPLSPLFASLAPEPVTQTVRRIGDELLGEDAFSQMGLGFTTINGYAYYFMSLTSRSTWQMVRLAPGAMRHMIVRQAGERLWRERFRPRYARAVDEWEARPIRDLPATELLAGVKELLYRGVQYYTGVQIIIPSAYISEALFAGLYDRLIKRPGDPPSQTFLLGFDSTPILADKSLYDLASWCRERPELSAMLLNTPSEAVNDLLETEQRAPAGVDEAVWRGWRSRFRDHLDRYGSMVYDLDFAKAVPSDDPTPTFNTLKYYLRGEGRSPHERQRAAAARREEATAAAMERLDPARREVFRGLLRWTQKYVPLREDALAYVGLAWPLMRQILRELGRRLIVAGAIEKPDDVFWLEGDELKGAAEALDAGLAAIETRSGAVAVRRSEWQARRLATPPPMLPKGAKFLGMDWERWMPARMGEPIGDTLEGVGASSGRATARARVLGGPEDFGEMRPGEVLVAGITTPAWTPLFAIASAVVTDVGGPLSHGSIVAREYGIPAVLGTGVATRRIGSGQIVQVDGDAGTVTLLNGAFAGRPAPDSAFRAHKKSGAVRGSLAALALGAAVAVVIWRRKRGRS